MIKLYILPQGKFVLTTPEAFVEANAQGIAEYFADQDYSQAQVLEILRSASEVGVTKTSGEYLGLANLARLTS